MPRPIISVENLGKCYRLHHQQQPRYTALRDVLAEKAKGFFSKPRAEQERQKVVEDFWALKNVSFEVQPGEVVGIIGRNGAGKSTLLKILSRITEPTEGRVTLRGRVASLLEVGTGFHPELTGRENIFLNGAILGMSRAEIRKKFDAIVAFAEVEKFLDTPVKRYSSGMYVRLAFAVAAHLEPEILIVDEVLAVGDAQFQKKCLGKMGEVASGGRTVLFVSHNMQAVQSMCSRCFLMVAGQMQAVGATTEVVGHYLAQTCSSNGVKVWEEADAPGAPELRLVGIRVLNESGQIHGVASTKSDLAVEMSFIASTGDAGLCVGFDLTNSEGVVVFRTYQTDLPEEKWPSVRRGWNRWRCRIPKGLLNGGVYFISPRISIHNVRWIVHLDNILEFEVVLDHGVSPFWNSLTGANRPGFIAPFFEWTAVSD